MKKSSRAEPVEEEEELEPLFDYRRVQPFNIDVIEDDTLDCPPVACMKKPKITATSAVEKNGKEEDCVIVRSDDKEEDDWLPPSPIITNGASVISEDSTRRELRLKRQELESLAQSAEEVLRSVEESAKLKFAVAESMNGVDASLKSPRKVGAEQPSKLSQDRAKVVISFQNKNGPMQVRVYMDDIFEKIFQNYAEKVKLDLKSLVFLFDGDKISPSATPGGLGMEDDDIIEVHVKTK